MSTPEDTEPRLLPAPPIAEDAAPSAVRLFACVGKDCRRTHDAGAVLDALRRTLATVDTGDVPVDVQPCGCLNICEQGPVVVAYGGAAAEAPRPPNGLSEAGENPPLATFTHVTPDKAGEIIDHVLTTLKEAPRHA